MQTPTEPLKFDTAYGALYIAISPATEQRAHISGQGNVTEVLPRVHVATDPTFEADPAHTDHWTIRGRAYAVHQVYNFRTMAPADSSRWRLGSNPYGGGFRNDKGRPVEVRTATYDLMDKAVSDALDEFEAEYPQWVDLSVYLLLTGKRESALAEAARLRKEAEQREDEAFDLNAKASPMVPGMPNDLFALLRN